MTAMTASEIFLLNRMNAVAWKTQLGTLLDAASDMSMWDATTTAYRVYHAHNGDGGTVLTADRTITWDVYNAARTIDIKGNVIFGGDVNITGTLTLTGAWTQTGAYTVGITTTGNTAITLPTSGTIAHISGESFDDVVELKLRDATTAAYTLQVIADSSATALTADRTLTFDVNNANRMIDLKGDLTLAGTWTHSGAHAVTITTTNTTSITLPTTGTLITSTAANTWTADQTVDNACKWKFHELTANGENFVSWRAADALGGDLEYIWPTATVDKGVLSVTAATGATAWALIVNDNIDNAAAIATSKLAAATQIGYLSLGGTITTGAAWTQTGAHTVGITTTNATTITLPTSGTLARTSGETFDDVVGLDLRDVTTVAFTLGIFSNGNGGTVMSADRDLTFDVYDADRAIDLKGNLFFAGDFTTAGAWTHTGAHTVGLTTVANTALEFNTNFKVCDQWLYASGTLTATQVRKLNATPVALIATPGADKMIIVDEVQLFMDWASQTYDSVGGGDDILIEYASGLDIIRFETTGFMDQGSDQHRYGKSSIFAVDGTTAGGIDIAAPANDAINITVLTGELAAADLDANGDSPLKWKIRYKIVDLLT